MKKCSKCGKRKQLSEFHKNSKSKDRVRSACKQCNAEYQRKFYRKRVLTSDDKRRKKAYKLKTKYNMTLDEHQLIYILQNGKCAICKRLIAYSDIKVDHDHETDKVRGLLCNYCNTRLATVEDGDFLSNALEYLNDH